MEGYPGVAMGSGGGGGGGGQETEGCPGVAVGSGGREVEGCPSLTPSPPPPSASHPSPNMSHRISFGSGQNTNFDVIVIQPPGLLAQWN